MDLFRWSIGALVVSTALVGHAAPPGPAAAENPDDAATKAVFAQFSAAWNKHDAAAITALFSEDAVKVEPHGTIVRSRAKIGEGYRGAHAGGLKNTTAQFTVSTIRVIGPDWRLVDGKASVVWAEGPDFNPMAARHMFTALLKRQGGAWVITDLRSYFTPPPNDKSRPLPEAASP